MTIVSTELQISKGSVILDRREMCGHFDPALLSRALSEV